MELLRPGRSLLSYQLRRAKLKHKDLAEFLQVSPSFISMVANNKREMSYVLAYNAAQFIGCRMEDLTTWEPEEDKRP